VIKSAHGGRIEMAKFGLFSPPKTTPNQEFEGDYMKQDGEYVKIFKNSTNPSVVDEQVAAIRLDKAQTVKKIG
jgi:hypothetical protein